MHMYVYIYISSSCGFSTSGIVFPGVVKRNCIMLNSDIIPYHYIHIYTHKIRFLYLLGKFATVMNCLYPTPLLFD